MEPARNIPALLLMGVDGAWSGADSLGWSGEKKVTFSSPNKHFSFAGVNQKPTEEYLHKKVKKGCLQIRENSEKYSGKCPSFSMVMIILELALVSLMTHSDTLLITIFLF